MRLKIPCKALSKKNTTTGVMVVSQMIDLRAAGKMVCVSSGMSTAHPASGRQLLPNRFDFTHLKTTCQYPGVVNGIWVGIAALRAAPQYPPKYH
jgi:hypothetical protein